MFSFHLLEKKYDGRKKGATIAAENTNFATTLYEQNRVRTHKRERCKSAAALPLECSENLSTSLGNREVGASDESEPEELPDFCP